MSYRLKAALVAAALAPVTMIVTVPAAMSLTACICCCGN